jgi:hypothetical protein
MLLELPADLNVILYLLCLGGSICKSFYNFCLAYRDSRKVCMHLSYAYYVS